MGRSRQADLEQPRESRKAELAAAVAALVIRGLTVATVPAVAALLLLSLRSFVLAFPALAASVAEEAARLTLTDPPAFDPEAEEFERRATLENVLLRGFFAQASARRLTQAVRGPSDTPTEERLAKARAAERSYLEAHRSAAARRLEGAKKTDRAREMFGEMVSWNHGARGTPEEPRPAHVAADGKTWALRRGIPISTGALPGVLPGCSCAWGPPKAGAEMLI